MTRSKRFEDKTAFITGAANGIGRATAIAFAAEGARVAITDRDEATLKETAERVNATGAEVLAIIRVRDYPITLDKLLDQLPGQP